jgi:hypothetical protein
LASTIGYPKELMAKIVVTNKAISKNIVELIGKLSLYLYHKSNGIGLRI